MSHCKVVLIQLLIVFFLLYSQLSQAETGDSDPTAQLLREAESILSGEKETETLFDSAQESIEGVVDNQQSELKKSTEAVVESNQASSSYEHHAETTQEPIILLDESISEVSEFTERLLEKDIVLVLDNSGSMKQNDPQFLASSAVREFIASMDETTRISIVIFDHSVRVAVPFTEVNERNKQALLASIDQVNYKGLYTDSPAAIERAIYDLKDKGRSKANKLIVFMTDGIVDTGKPDMDLEKARWLKADLAADAADNEIQIFGIAFTESADFQLIQSLAQKTRGEYYRALTPDDLPRVFEKINIIINTPQEAEVVLEPSGVPVPPTPQVIQEILPPAPSPEPVIIEVPIQVTDEETKKRSNLLMLGISVMIIALISILILLIRKGRDGDRVQEAPVHEAFINDIHGHTDKAAYKLGSKPVMFGRVAGKDTQHLDYIVIPQTTVGRRHALIEYKEFAYWIVDQGSINGTFINDKAITAETRLKHGDRIRLHKFELEFTVPEMADDGMTVISNTVFSGLPENQIENVEHDKTRVRSDSPSAHQSEVESVAAEPEFEFDITSGIANDEDETVLRQEPADSLKEANSDEVRENDETIMLDDNPVAAQDEEFTLRGRIPDSDDENFVETEEFNLDDLNKK